MWPPGVREAARHPPPFFIRTKAGQIRWEELSFFVISISKAIIEQPVSSLETGGALRLLFEEVFFFCCLFTNLLFGGRLLYMCADQEKRPELTGWVGGGVKQLFGMMPLRLKR